MVDMNFKDEIKKSIERLKDMHIPKPYAIFCNPVDAEEIKENSCGNKVIATYLVQKGMVYICNPQAVGITAEEVDE